MSNLRRMMMAAAMNKGVPTTYLTDEVKTYATLFNVLDGLNEYIGEHPKMIKYINEWKYIIHSLGLGTGYTSWLKGDGAAYIDTGMSINQDSKFEILIYNLENVGCAIFGHRDSATSNNVTITNNSTDIVFDYCNYQICRQYSTAEINSLYKIGAEGFNRIYIYKNGDKVVDLSISSHKTDFESKPIRIFDFIAKSSSSHKPYKGEISYVNIDDSSFLPYYDSKSRMFGMLNVAADTPKFYGAEPNTGEFTWSLTDADGNVM